MTLYRNQFVEYVNPMSRFNKLQFDSLGDFCNRACQFPVLLYAIYMYITIFIIKMNVGIEKSMEVFGFTALYKRPRFSPYRRRDSQITRVG